MALLRLMGMRAEVFKIHQSGHVDVYLYRGEHGHCIAIAQYHGDPMRYRLEPTDQAKGDDHGGWFPDLGECVRRARAWE